MRVRLIKTVDFEAAHFLPAFPEGHKCRRMHGHSFVVDLILEGELPEGQPYLVDMGEVKAAFAPLREQLDHHLLNDVPGLENPSVEMISRWVFDRLRGDVPFLIGVRVHETPTSAGEYWGD